LHRRVPFCPEGRPRSPSSVSLVALRGRPIQAALPPAPPCLHRLQPTKPHLDQFRHPTSSGLRFDVVASTTVTRISASHGQLRGMPNLSSPGA
jgi:hypothetical protein